MVTFVAARESERLFFLMNDVVLSLDSQTMALPLDAERFRSLSLPFVIKLGQELYAEHPRLQHTDVEKARRLALLITAKKPDINAALFVTPAEGCAPDQVMARYCQVSFDVMAALMKRQEEGVLTAVNTDTQVWRRLAA